MDKLTVDEPGWYQLSGTVPLKGTGMHKVESLTWAVATNRWTRIGRWEVFQTSGANVNVTVTSDGEVHLPCAGIVRQYVDRGPFPRAMATTDVSPTELGSNPVQVTWPEA